MEKLVRHGQLYMDKGLNYAFAVKGRDITNLYLLNDGEQREFVLPELELTQADKEFANNRTEYLKGSTQICIDDIENGSTLIIPGKGSLKFYSERSRTVNLHIALPKGMELFEVRERWEDHMDTPYFKTWLLVAGAQLKNNTQEALATPKSLYDSYYSFVPYEENKSLASGKSFLQVDLSHFDQEN